MNHFTFLFVISILTIFSSCTKKEAVTFSIQGRISPVKNNFIILKQNIDIEKKLTKFIDTLYLNEKGEFKAGYNLEPHLYTLQLDAKKSIPLAIDSNQNITINITDFDTKKFKTQISGSKDASQLLAYEAFRAKSLDTLVKTVRRAVKKLKKVKILTKIK